MLRYRPFSLRQHLLIVALAIGTAIGVVLVIVAPPGAVSRTPRPPVRPCVEDGTVHCVGGKLDVIVVPAPAGSAAAP